MTMKKLTGRCPSCTARMFEPTQAGLSILGRHHTLYLFDFESVKGELRIPCKRCGKVNLVVLDSVT